MIYTTGHVVQAAAAAGHQVDIRDVREWASSHRVQRIGSGYAFSRKNVKDFVAALSEEDDRKDDV